jgi:lipopolysaccharide export system permease protein
VLISAALVPFNTNLTPRAMERFRSLFHQIATTDPLIQIEPKRFISVQNMRLYAATVSKDKKFLEGVWIYRHFPDHIQRVFARRGQAAVDSRHLTLTLEDGQIERFHHGPEREFLHIAFKNYSLRIPFKAGLNARDRSWREYTASGLRTEIARRKSLRLPFSELEAEFHLRFALAFAPLALALIGISLGMTLERGGRGVGFGAAIGVLFFYYLLLVMGLNLAERGAWPPGPALWIANATAALAGIVLYKQRMNY